MKKRLFLLLLMILMGLFFTACSKKQKFTVTWLNYDDEILYVDANVEQGTLPTYVGPAPTKQGEEGYDYIFSGWSPEITPITENSKFRAQFKEVPKTYRVIWMNEGEIIEIDLNVSHGDMPIYDGITPVKPSDEQYTYTFSGWLPEVSAVTSNVVYEAQFDAVENTFKVVWMNGEEVLEIDKNVPYGTMPSYDGDTPTKPATEHHIYTFSGWLPEISEVTGDIVYMAQFDETVNNHIVIWENYDGTVLEIDTDVPTGTIPTYDGEPPTKPKDAQYTYTFSGWLPEVSAFVSDITYTAQFDEVLNTYTITWKNGDEILETDLNVPYGATPEYNGEEPTKEGDAQYSYQFNGWLPEISMVTGDAVYEAQFIEVLNKYTVTWVNEEEILEVDKNVPYGATPEYNGDDPTKTGDAQYSYQFNGWLPEISEVTGNVIYEAQFTKILNTYTVTWENYDGTVLETDTEVPYGDMPEYNGEDPTREGDAQYSYQFNGWFPEISKVTGNITYTAQFIEIQSPCTITFTNTGDTPIDPITEDYNTTLDVLPTPTRLGYQFLGWYDGSTLKTAPYTIVGDATLTAKWGEIVKQVTFNLNGGSLPLGYDTLTSVPFLDFPYDLPTPNKINTDGGVYGFLGWYENEEFEGTPLNQLTDVKDYTLYAKWADYMVYYKGEYPQTKVTDAALKATLDTLTPVATSKTLITPTGVSNTETWYTLEYEDNKYEKVGNEYYKYEPLLFYKLPDGTLYSKFVIDYSPYDAQYPVTKKFTDSYVYKYLNEVIKAKTGLDSLFSLMTSSQLSEPNFVDDNSRIATSTDYATVVCSGGRGNITGFEAYYSSGLKNMYWRIQYNRTYDDYAPRVNENGYLAASTTEGAHGLRITLPVTYTINFDGNGSDGGEMENQKIEVGVLTELNPNCFYKTDYILKHWCTTNDGTGTTYTDKKEVKDLAAANDTIILYAIWEEHLIEVTFSAGEGGSLGEIPNSVSVIYGRKVTEPLLEPTKPNHQFIGWRLPGATDNYDFDTAVIEPITLTAYFEIDKYTVTFSAGEGGSLGGIPETVIVEHGATVSAPEGIPTKPNHLFKHWALPDSLDTAYVFSTQVVSNITLVAVYNEAVTITFDIDGGQLEGLNTSVDIVKGETVSNPGNPYKVSHEFLGWRILPATENYDFNTAVNYSITLTAVYRLLETDAEKIQEVKDHLHYDGTVYNEGDDQDFITTYPNGATIEWAFDPAASVVASKFVAVGGLDITVVATGTIKVGTTTDTYIANITVRAPRVTVTFNIDGGELLVFEEFVEVIKGQKVDNPGSPTKANHKFLGWRILPSSENYDFNTAVNSSITLTAVYEMGVTVNFNLNGGSLPIGYDIEMWILYENLPYTLPIPTKEASGEVMYEFFGWYESEIFEGSALNQLNDVKEYTLYAKWREYVYRGEYPQTKVTDATLKATLDTLTPVATSKTLTTSKGTSNTETWYTVEYEGNKYEKIGTEYYKYEPIVFYKLPDGTLYSKLVIDYSPYDERYYGAKNFADSYVYKYLNEVIKAKTGLDSLFSLMTESQLYEPNFVDDNSRIVTSTDYATVVCGGGRGNITGFEAYYSSGLKNMYWRIKDNRTYDDYAPRVNENGYLAASTTEGAHGLRITLPVTYTINFDGNGSDGGEMESQKIEVGVLTKLNPNCFTRAGYIFKHWCTKNDGTGTTYTDKKEVKDLVTANETITLYAIWEETP